MKKIKNYSEKFKNEKFKTENSEKNKKFFSSDLIVALGLFGTVGFIILANILVCIFIYKLFARYVYESNLLFIFFLIVGVISGFYNVYKNIFIKK